MLCCVEEDQGSVAVLHTHQDEVSLIGGQHEHRDVVVGERGDDRFGDLGDSDWLRVGGVPAP